MTNYLDVSGELHVEIDKSRWEVTITITDAQGKQIVTVASADRAYTDGDGIWIGDYSEWMIYYE